MTKEKGTGKKKAIVAGPLEDAEEYVFLSAVCGRKGWRRIAAGPAGKPTRAGRRGQAPDGAEGG